MTEQERDELLLELRDTLRDHGERLERIENDHGERLERIENGHGERLERIENDHGERLERIENDHGSALRALRGELNAIRVVLTGDRAQYYQLAERVAELERQAG